MKGRPWPASAVASLAALWMAAAGNLPLWQRLAELDPLNPAQRALLMGVMLGVLWSALMLLLSLFTWRLWLKPVLTLLPGEFATSPEKCNSGARNPLMQRANPASCYTRVAAN